jgi:hypothetical protein
MAVEGKEWRRIKKKNKKNKKSMRRVIRKKR